MTVCCNGLETRVSEAISAGKPFGIVLVRLGDAYLRDKKTLYEADAGMGEIIRRTSVPRISDGKPVSFEVLAHETGRYYLLPLNASLGDCWVLRQELATRLMGAGYKDAEIACREHHPEYAQDTAASIVRMLELALC